MKYGLTDCEIQMLAGTLGEIGSMRGMPASRLWPPGETARVELIKTLAPTLRKAAEALPEIIDLRRACRELVDTSNRNYLRARAAERVVEAAKWHRMATSIKDATMARADLDAALDAYDAASKEGKGNG